MMQRTVGPLRPAERLEAQTPENAFPITFLALAFGLIAGISIACVVAPTVARIVVPIVSRIVIGE